MPFYMDHLPIEVLVVLNVSAETAQHELRYEYGRERHGDFVQLAEKIIADFRLPQPPRSGMFWSEQPAPSIVLRWKFCSRRQVRGCLHLSLRDLLISWCIRAKHISTSVGPS
jgi:hypothetical protein